MIPRRSRLQRNSPSVLLILLLLVGLPIRGGSAQDAKPVFRAGAATSNITPPLGQPIVGGWKPLPAGHIHDELYARCLVLDDGRVQLAIVLCDNVGIPREVFELAKNKVLRRHSQGTSADGRHPHPLRHHSTRSQQGDLAR